VPIAKFKSNKLSHINKKQADQDFKNMKSDEGAMSPSNFKAVRMPNVLSINTQKVADHDVNFKTEEVSSPTSFLKGGPAFDFSSASK
jgi:hypothetical protein